MEEMENCKTLVAGWGAVSLAFWDRKVLAVHLNQLGTVSQMHRHSEKARLWGGLQRSRGCG